MTPQHDVCLVGLKCLDYLRRVDKPRYLGGIERQLTLLGRLLSESGLKVCFVTYDDGNRDVECIDGMDVYKSYAPAQGIPGLRFFYPRSYRLWKAIRFARARTVIQMGAGTETGIAAISSRGIWFRSNFIFLAASDGDCRRDNPSVTSVHERLLYAFGLSRADTIIVQTARQAELIREHFGRSSEIQHLPAVVDGSSDESATARSNRLEANPTIHVLWVGRIVKEKRPHWLLHAAECHPDIQFDVVGESNLSTQFASNFINKAAELPNVVLHGKLGDAQLRERYRASSMLLCTSSIEGFPTTFLESWAFGTPVVTSFDPDGIVQEFGLGHTFRELSELSSIIDEILKFENQMRLSEKALKFFRARYSPGATLPSIRRLIELEA